MCLAKSHGMGQQQQQRAMLTGVVYANAAAQLMKMIYVSSAHQANNTADIDSASSLYHDYVSLHFYQVMEASTSCSFAAKVQETGNVSLLTEASKLQARDADFGKNLQYSGEMDWKLGARLSTSSGPATRDSFNGDNSIQPKWLSGSLRQAYMFTVLRNCQLLGP